MLIVLVWRERSAEGASLLSRRGRLPLLTGVFGLIWNVGALASFGVGLANLGVPVPIVIAVAFAALGCLPAVVVQSLLEGRETAASASFVRLATIAAYGLSVAAGVLHAMAVVDGRPVPSPTALWLLTIGFTVLALLLLVVTRQQPIGRRGVWVVAISIFAVSALHFNRHVGNESWRVELIGHHASLALALAILHQDYRFAFADLFLKNAIALLVLVGASLVLFAGVMLPVLRWEDPLGFSDPRAIALVIALWIATVVAYGEVRRATGRFVDRSVLGRPDYEQLLDEFAERLESAEDEDSALACAAETMSRSLGVADVRIVSDPLPVHSGRHAIVGPALRGVVSDQGATALIRVRTVDAPHVALMPGPLRAGRRLLSDDVHWLEAVARLVARRIDGLRVSQERVAHAVREQAMERLTTQAELRALRAQLNPHFLFNALTTIGYLIQHAPPRAFDTLMRLTSVLRGVLRHTSREFSTLGEEIDLIASYLEIERARFEERLGVSIDVAPGLRAMPVPALLLQPLVENAIRHGVAPLARGGSVAIRAAATGDHLTLVVEDSGAGFAQQATGSGGGVGLRSVEERLRVHCGAAASLTVDSAFGAGTVVTIVLPVAVPVRSNETRRQAS